MHFIIFNKHNLRISTSMFIWKIRAASLPDTRSQKGLELSEFEISLKYPDFSWRFNEITFTPFWNSYRIGLLFPFKTNNSARFLYRIAFTTQRFWKWYKIYRIGLQRHENMPKYNGSSWIDWFYVQFWFLHVKAGNIIKPIM